jgi:hypothetical protein
MPDKSRDEAVAALTAAAKTEHDFPGWLADVLAVVSAKLGSTAALTAGRPGSWEAALVRQLVEGTVGEDLEQWAAGTKTHLAPPEQSDDSVRKIGEAVEYKMTLMADGHFADVYGEPDFPGQPLFALMTDAAYAYLRHLERVQEAGGVAGQQGVPLFIATGTVPQEALLTALDENLTEIKTPNPGAVPVDGWSVWQVVVPAGDVCPACQAPLNADGSCSQASGVCPLCQAPLNADGSCSASCAGVGDA